MEKFNKYAVPAGLVVVIAMLAFVAFGGGGDGPVARSTYNVPVYVEQGGSKMVVESGGAIEVQSGGSIALTPGATLAVGGLDSDNLVVNAPTAIGTATPAALINSAGVSNLLEVQDGGSAVVQAFNGGGVKVAAATAQATAQPAFQVDSAGVSNILEVRDAATPVYQVHNGGNVTASGGQTINNWAVVAAPTAIATATPAMVVNSAGVSNILEVQDGGSAIAQFRNGGTLDLIGNTIEQDLGTENLGVLPSVCTKSITYTAAAGGTGTVCDIGANEVWYIHAVFANVTTNWDATGDDVLVEIGDASDTDGLLDLDDGELQTTDTEGTGAPAGWQGFMSTDTRGAYLANGHGFIYNPGSAETIDYIIDETSGESITAGALTVYVVYTRLQ